MALVDLNHVKQLFGSKGHNQTGPEVYRELLLMVLARATDADSYTHPAEVAVVQAVLQDQIGEAVDSSTVRVAARSKLYETAPLEKYIARVGSQLDKSERLGIINALVQVLKADEYLATSEVSYFNMVAQAMGLSFADVAGLVVEGEGQ